MTGGWVYIVASKPHGVIYIGVTANLVERTGQHRSGVGGSKFARKYNCARLVYAEPHATMLEAIAREKAIKEWPRLWRLRLIQEHNPQWRDLFDDLNGWPEAVVPAQAGISGGDGRRRKWNAPLVAETSRPEIPAFAGMTRGKWSAPDCRCVFSPRSRPSPGRRVLA